MQIVQQLAVSSYSLILPYPLLAPPPVYPALPAPRISGLLCAPKHTITVEKYTAFDALMDEIGPIRSKEEMDAELDAIMTPFNREFYRWSISRNREFEQ
jgi:hypothetical protein